MINCSQQHAYATITQKLQDSVVNLIARTHTNTQTHTQHTDTHTDTHTTHTQTHTHTKSNCPLS